jgi:hypothetical protein
MISLASISKSTAAARVRSLDKSISLSNRFKHTVRVILVDDLSSGQGYAGEVHTVAAGYARNYLIPTKKALYATPTSFQRVGIVDPLLEPTTTVGGTNTMITQPGVRRPLEEEDQYVKAADFLRFYLRNKVLKMWRNIDTSVSSSASSSSSSSGMLQLMTYPGMVDAKAIKNKLSQQLKIDLEEEEYIQLAATPVSHDLVDGVTTQGQQMMEQLLSSMFVDTNKEGGESSKDVEIRQLGEYLAKIHLKGNQSVGLRFSILKR